MHTVIIFPNTIFQKNNLIKKNTHVYIIEHHYFFTKYNYHKTKLMLHRASLKSYEQYLKNKYKIKAKYVDFQNSESCIQNIFKINSNVSCYDPVNHQIVEQLKNLAKKFNVELQISETPLFIETTVELKEYIGKTNNYKNHAFYLWQRKRLNVLMDGNKPIGGRWSYDTENRKPFPKNYAEEKLQLVNNKYITEAKKYVTKHFKNNFGELISYLPIDFDQSKVYFKKFLRKKLSLFGPYEDAVNSNVVFGNHSAISPLLNIGLLTPRYVVDCVLKEYAKGKCPIESAEGYIRQVIGWRSHIRMIYFLQQEALVKNNFFNHNRKLKKSWYNSKTDIQPIDDTIDKLRKYGYIHHIERLMYIGNFMLLNNIKPLDCFKFFMTTVDCYDWVMMPNIYGMSQYSAGSLMMTRPYFSSSNYIFKLSNYKRDKSSLQVVLKSGSYYWYEIWDALYYNFVNKNQKYLNKNYSTIHAVSNWNRKSLEQQKQYIKIAKDYLSKY